MERYMNPFTTLMSNQVFDDTIQMYAGGHIKAKEKELVDDLLHEEYLKLFCEECCLVKVIIWENAPPSAAIAPDIERWMIADEALEKYGSPNSQGKEEWQYY